MEHYLEAKALPIAWSDVLTEDHKKQRAALKAS